MPVAHKQIYEGQSVVLTDAFASVGSVIYEQVSQWNVYPLSGIPDDGTAPPIVGSGGGDGGNFPGTGVGGWSLTGNADAPLVTAPAGSGGEETAAYLVQIVPSTIGLGQGAAVPVKWYYLVVQAGETSPVDRFRRFLRVDWSTDAGNRLVTRVRFKLGGGGAQNAAIALVRGADLPEVLIPSIPLSPDDGDDGMHSFLLPTPQLAQGIVFYPDYHLPAPPEGEGVVYPPVTLSQLQVYEAAGSGGNGNSGSFPAPVIRAHGVLVANVPRILVSGN